MVSKYLQLMFMMMCARCFVYLVSGNNQLEAMKSVNDFMTDLVEEIKEVNE